MAQQTVKQPGTQAAAFEMLMNSIGSLLSPVVQQLVNSDPGLVQLKGWHGMTALHRACLIGEYSIVLMLIQANSDVNAVTDFNETPLHYASKRGVSTVVHLLLQCGAKSDARDNRGRNALHHAAESGAVNVFRYLDDAFGMDTRDVDVNRMSPMHIACTHGHFDLFYYLMKKGRSDLRQEDSEGNLPIHITAKGDFGHITWLMLCILGVPVLGKRNNSGRTPQDLAEQSDKSGNKQLISVLKYYSSKPDDTIVCGPTYTWYFLLLYPFMLYTVLIIIIQHLDSYQYVILLLGMLQVYIQLKGLGHRMMDVSRWPNPFFAGFFYGGIVHTTICYIYHMLPYFFSYFLILALSLILCTLLHFVFIKTILQNPGSVAASSADLKTGKPITFVDLCKMRNPPYKFCSFCDIITSANTKHCKLCNKCFYRMDHHCLYLLKCVAVDNHPMFIWLIILVLVNTVLFCFGVGVYVYTFYSGDFSDVFSQLIHKEAWMCSLFGLNAGASFWCLSLLQYQFSLVTRGRTAYFCKGKYEFVQMSTVQMLNNFIHFLLYKPLPMASFTDNHDCEANNV